MNRIVAVACVVSMVSLTGCEAMRTTLRAKETQGMLLGALLGAGSFSLIGGIDRHGGLGRWALMGGSVGGLAGWYVGHQLEERPKGSKF